VNQVAEANAASGRRHRVDGGRRAKLAHARTEIHMPLKRADHHHEPTRTLWHDGRDGVLFTMEDAEIERADPIRCFATRGVLEALRGDITQSMDLIVVFDARRQFLEKAAERLYDTSGRPIEIVLTEENYTALRAGLSTIE
jgi:Protein of unknown function (DUF1488)